MFMTLESMMMSRCVETNRFADPIGRSSSPVTVNSTMVLSITSCMYPDSRSCTSLTVCSVLPSLRSFRPVKDRLTIGNQRVKRGK